MIFKKANYKLKLSGKSCSKVIILYSFLDFAKTISKSFLQNSARTWRQTPHGGQKFSIFPFFPPTIAIASNSFLPSLTALKIAVLSAQLLGP